MPCSEADGKGKEAGQPLEAKTIEAGDEGEPCRMAEGSAMPVTAISVIKNISPARSKMDLLAVITVFAAINYAIYTLSWLIYTDNMSHPKDWLMFWDTSNLITYTKLGKIYPGVTPSLPFIYPPPFLFLIYPLKYLSKPFGYMTIIVFSVTMLISAFRVMGSIFKLRRSDFLCLCIIILSSASWIIMLPLGHFSSLYLFLVCAGLKLRELRMPWRSGLVLSLLMLKPNIGIMFPFLFLLRRDFKLVAGWVAGMGALISFSVLAFKSVWSDYFASMTTLNTIIGETLPWKHHTLHALLRSLLPSSDPQLLLWVWISTVIPLILLCAYAWYSSKDCTEHYPRLFGIAILTTITCNPYFHHYDAILAALPAFTWFSNKHKYHFGFSYGVIGASLVLAYLVQQISVFYVQRGPSLVSIPLALYLVIDCLDLISSNYKRT